MKWLISLLCLAIGSTADSRAPQLIHSASHSPSNFHQEYSLPSESEMPTVFKIFSAHFPNQELPTPAPLLTKLPTKTFSNFFESNSNHAFTSKELNQFAEKHFPTLPELEYGIPQLGFSEFSQEDSDESEEDNGFQKPAVNLHIPAKPYTQFANGPSKPVQKPLGEYVIPHKPHEVSQKPHDEYVVPHKSQEEYVVPHKPHEEYVAPHKPHEEYVIPHKPHEVSQKPHDEYVVPHKSQEEYVVPHKPHEEYVAPHKPHEEYVIPHKPHEVSQKPHDEYVVPHTPQEEYVVPHKPHEEYVAPHKPHKEYVVPHKLHEVPHKPHEEYVVPLKPHEEYVAPHKPHEEYVVPHKPHEEYVAPHNLHEEYEVPHKPNQQYQVPAKPIVDYVAPTPKPTTIRPIEPWFPSHKPVTSYPESKPILSPILHRPLVPVEEPIIQTSTSQTPALQYQVSTTQHSFPPFETTTFKPIEPLQQYAVPSSQFLTPLESSGNLWETPYLFFVPVACQSCPQSFFETQEPHLDYAPPNKPSQDYVIPTTKKPVWEYGPPEKPAAEYSPPSANQCPPETPSQEFGVPINSHPKPAVDYVVPNTKPLSIEHGLPDLHIKPFNKPTITLKPDTEYGLPNVATHSFAKPTMTEASKPYPAANYHNSVAEHPHPAAEDSYPTAEVAKENSLGVQNNEYAYPGIVYGYNFAPYSTNYYLTHQTNQNNYQGKSRTTEEETASFHIPNVSYYP